MLKLFITLQVAALAVLDCPGGPHHQADATSAARVTIEQVIWAGAVIVIVGIVVAAIKRIRDQRGRERSSRPPHVRQLSTTPTGTSAGQ